MFLDLIFLLCPTLFLRYIKPASANIRLIQKHSRSSSFSPCPSAIQICSLRGYLSSNSCQDTFPLFDAF